MDEARARWPIPIPRHLPLFLFIAIALVLAGHFAMAVYNYRVHEVPWYLEEILDVDEEQSFCTWVSAATMLVAAALLLAIAGRRREERARDAAHWYGLAIGFTAMSLDEVAGVHETLHTWSGIDWTLPGALLVLAIGAFYVPFLIRLPGRMRAQFLIAGAIYVGGALGVERLTIQLQPIFQNVDSLMYKSLAGLEEGMEMIGVALFVTFLLAHMRRLDAGRAPVVVDLEPV
jgi:hypothetical protein